MKGLKANIIEIFLSYSYHLTFEGDWEYRGIHSGLAFGGF